MHQHPRQPSAAASPGNSPQPNPGRASIPKTSEPSSPRPGSETRLSVEIGQGETAGTDSTPRTPRGQNHLTEKDDYLKLNQVIQNFYTKAALIILSHRAALAPAMSKETNEKRVNKWFNVEVDETNDLLEFLRTWKNTQVQERRPPAMNIEVFIDATPTTSHSLILQDGLGHQWGVEDAIKSYIDTNCYGEKMPSTPRIVLERWRCQLGRQVHDLPADLNATLPKVYKNSIVLFRSLFAYLKLLPAWDITKKSRKLSPSQKLPKVQYRIYEDVKGSNPEPPVFDELEIALDDGQSSVTENFAFDPIDSPSGPYSIEVTFRRNCDFRLEKSMESVYSSRFIGQDEELFKPSLERYSDQPQFRRRDSDTPRPDLGSLPQRRPNLAEISEQSQAYGSLSTYHGTIGRISSSPMSALRAARDMNPDSPSETSPPSKAPAENRLSQGSRVSLRSNDGSAGMARRPSVSFMPFKTPSLAASPLQAEVNPAAAARAPIGRTSALSALAEARKPTSTPLAPLARASPAPAVHHDPQNPASLSSSPRPQSSRYSSSFGHRRSRLSIGGSKTEDDNSSGKVSLASSTQRESIAAEGGNNSSGSLPTDDDNISDFLKMLDKNKDLKSFEAPAEGTSGESTQRRSNTVLSRFQRLKDTNAALTDTMTTSLQLNRSPGLSSRQASGVPAMLAGTSTSPSSSPAERMSPRTPHTPAVPSRLSANSIINYSGGRAAVETSDGVQEAQSRHSRQRESDTTSPRGTGAIDIPTSPRFHASYRRSSSVAQQQRLYEDDLGVSISDAMRRASMDDRGERQPVPMNELLSAQEGQNTDRSQATAQRQQSRVGGGTAMDRQRSAESHKSQDDEPFTSPQGVARRSRIARGSGRGISPSRDSSNSLGGERGAGSGNSDTRGSRYSFTRPSNFEDEDMLFTMSDFNTAQQGRRSLEDTPRASTAADPDGPCGSSSQRSGGRDGRG